MDEAGAKAVRAQGAIGLAVAAVAITALGLTGPLILALGCDPSTVLPLYPLGWAAAVGGWLWWLRAWRTAKRVRRGG